MSWRHRAACLPPSPLATHCCTAHWQVCLGGFVCSGKGGVVLCGVPFLPTSIPFQCNVYLLPVHVCSRMGIQRELVRAYAVAERTPELSSATAISPSKPHPQPLTGPHVLFISLPRCIKRINSLPAGGAAAAHASPEHDNEHCTHLTSLAPRRPCSCSCSRCPCSPKSERPAAGELLMSLGVNGRAGSLY